MPGHGSDVMIVTACLAVPGMQEYQVANQVDFEGGQSIKDDLEECRVRTQTQIPSGLLKQKTGRGVEAEDSLRRLMSFIITNCLLPSGAIHTVHTLWSY